MNASGTALLSTFLVFFVVFAFLGFYGSRWRRGDLNKLHEWALAGRRLGTLLVFFLVGADLYTAYTFVAVPSGVFAKGALFFFAVPYVGITFAVALIFGPRLWEVSKKNGYITGSDFVKARFNSRTLGMLTALTGIVALLPYIALQIVGMQAVLATIFYVLGAGSHAVEEVSLIISFLILAAFTFTSGLRGATLTAVFKDILIWVTVVVTIVATLVSVGGFHAAFAKAPASFKTLPGVLMPGYMTLVLGSALALYMYPHAVNGILSAESKHKLRVSTSLLPLYGVGLALLALFGILVYAEAPALAIVKHFNSGIYAVPALVVATVPSWFAGIALLGIFVGGLVPAAIMAIAQANLLTRNIIKEFRPDLTEKGESDISKWASAAFKFIALGFVFVVSSTYAIQLQLLGGILILQILPSLFLGLYTRWFKKEALIAGLLLGLFSGVYMAFEANVVKGQFTGFNSSLFHTALGSLYIGVLALAINLAVTLVLSAVIPRREQIRVEEAQPKAEPQR